MKQILTLFFVICSILVYSQPANDSCFQAITIPLINNVGAFSGNTSGATASNPILFTSSCLSTLPSINDVWFEFTTPSSGNPNYIISVDGGTVMANPAVGLYTGLCNPTGQVMFESQCTNYSPANSQVAELLAFGLTPNTSYFVRITNYGMSSLNFTGTITPFLFSNNDSCSQATPIPLTNNTGSFSGTLYSATASNPTLPPNSCLAPLAGTEDLWFEFTTPSSGNLDYEIVVDASIGIGNPAVAVYSGLCNSFTEISCVNNSPVNNSMATVTLLGLNPNTTYYIQVMDYGASNYFTGTISPYTPPADYDIGAISIHKGDTSCQVSLTDTISMIIENVGLLPVDNFSVSYKVKGQSAKTEIYTDTLQPNTIDTFVFTQTANLSKNWEIQIDGWTTFALDTTNNNDTTQLIKNCICYDSVGTTPHFCQQFIIKYDGTSTEADIDTIIQKAIAAGVHILDSIRCDTFYADLWSSPEFLLWDTLLINMEADKEKLSKSTAEINSVDFNTLMDSSSTKSQSISQLKQQMVDRVNQQEGINTTEDFVKVVILDTGMDGLPAQFELTDTCSTCPGFPYIIGGYDFFNDDFDFDDDNDNHGLAIGHGTKVTNIMIDYILQNNIQNVKLIPFKVLNENGQGTAWTMVLGMAAATIINADVVNASLGYYGEESKVMKSLISRLGENCHGVFIASAGNKGWNTDDSLHYPSNFTQDLNNVISVGALNDTLALADYSNYGLTTVDVYAPGGITVTLPSGQHVDEQGTSFAAPFVTSRIIGMIDREPSINARQIKEAISYLYYKHLPSYPYPPYPQDTSGNDLNSVMHLGDSTFLYGYVDTATLDANCGIIDCIHVGTSNVNGNGIIKPEQLQVYAYPNPFSNEIIFDIDLPYNEMDDIEFSVYDMMGRLIYRKHEPFVQDKHRIRWNGANLPAGMYFCEIQTKKGIGIVKIIKGK